MCGNHAWGQNMKKKDRSGTTIKDVARETNLAISTISKYMNGGTVRKKNQELIEAAVKKLNYFPNNTARWLRTSKTYRVGVIAGIVNSPHTSVILNEIEKKLRDHGYSVSFFSFDENLDKTKEYVEYMIANGVDGMLITIPGNTDGHLILPENLRVPVVTIEENSGIIQGDCVQTSCTQGAYEITEYLIKNGHSRIAVIEGRRNSLTASERMKGYFRAMEDYGIPVRPEYVVQGDYVYQGGYRGIHELWKLNEKPTAVFVTNYDMSMGAMEAIYDLEIRIPQQLSVAVFDDFELSVMVNPNLTSVRQPLVELADAACELLLRRMNGDESDYPKRIRLKPSCIYRESVQNLNSSQ